MVVDEFDLSKMKPSGLPPIVGTDARVLILGSFPGAVSIRQRQYYAHPRNQFWTIIEHLFGIARTAPYPKRCRQLVERHLALWDVIRQCQRPGSLDSKIREAEANDFAEFYKRCPQIVAVFWNGSAAEHHYRTLVGMTLRTAGCDALGQDGLYGDRLPSTSPAHATVSLADKVGQWRVLRDALAGSLPGQRTATLRPKNKGMKPD